MASNMSNQGVTDGETFQAFGETEEVDLNIYVWKFVSEAAEILRVKPKTIYERSRAGDYKRRKVGSQEAEVALKRKVVEAYDRSKGLTVVSPQLDEPLNNSDDPVDTSNKPSHQSETKGTESDALVMTLQKMVDQIQSQNELIRDGQKELTKELEEKRREITKAQTAHQLVNTDLTNAQSKIKELQDLKQKAEAERERVAQELDDIKSKLDAKDLEVKQHQEQLEAKAQLEAERDRALAELENVKRQLDEKNQEVKPGLFTGIARLFGVK